MDNPCLTLPKISYPLSCLDDAVLAALGFGFLCLAFGFCGNLAQGWFVSRVAE